MVLASITWRVIEGSLWETVCCCVLYILNPLRSFWVTPLATGEPDTILKYIKTPHAGHAVFMAVMYSVLLAEHFEDINTVTRTVFFCTLVLVCLLFITQLTKEKMLSCSGELCRKVYSKVQPLVATCSFSLLPALQLALLLYTCFDFGAVFIITVLTVVPGIHHCFGRISWINRCCLCVYKLIWFMMIVMSGAMVYFYTRILRIEKEGAGLVCAAGILQALWMVAFSEDPVHYPNLLKRKKFFLFGSAGLVLSNSVVLMTEVIINGVKGERLIGDLRVVVVPSEWLFTTLPLLSLSIYAQCEYDLEVTLAFCTITLLVYDII
ncbi:hypothetical protein F2P79_025135 [Pimephales promelas]|nr:hypothetical protein F2P79_025135 [Pimephales promelas]